MPDTPLPTRALTIRGQSLYVRRFAVTVSAGPDAGRRIESSRDELTIGTDPSNDLHLTDPSVSRHHCVLRATERGLEVRDLGSTNGTVCGAVEVVRAYLTGNGELVLGRTKVTVERLDSEIASALAGVDRMGELVGSSPAMRRMYALLARYAETEGTVLITGETGTGKELAAEAIHAASARRDQPFVVVDCSALPGQLSESELFGHVRGAFTGADADRVGALARAQHGTVFLDEIGELPLALQPLLLRALEARTIRPIGSDREISLDIRVIAATHRDLRTEVNRKRFRSDLYFRLSVLQVEMPPLRERDGDTEILVQHLWQQLRPGGVAPKEVVSGLARLDWPGNVRELRNAVERAATIGVQRGVVEALTTSALSYGEAKLVAVDVWEARWVAELIATHAGNLSAAARAARMGRSNLRGLLRKHGVELD
ncbi:MAG: sigma 54-interacting transcriptional regulator [Kofleriaceae bacterium]